MSLNYNPLLNNLTDLKDSDLANKQEDLNTKLMFARRMGNGALCEQIQIALAQINGELNRRYAILLDNMEKKSGLDNKKYIKIS